MESVAPDAVALCCCGGSMKKPVCDDIHSKVGLGRVVQRAVRKREGRV
jgi:CDGSH-type Zn-finger protein